MTGVLSSSPSSQWNASGTGIQSETQATSVLQGFYRDEISARLTRLKVHPGLKIFMKSAPKVNSVRCRLWKTQHQKHTINTSLYRSSTANLVWRKKKVLSQKWCKFDKHCLIIKTGMKGIQITLGMNFDKAFTK